MHVDSTFKQMSGLNVVQKLQQVTETLDEALPVHGAPERLRGLSAAQCSSIKKDLQAIEDSQALTEPQQFQVAGLRRRLNRACSRDVLSYQPFLERVRTFLLTTGVQQAHLTQRFDHQAYYHHILQQHENQLQNLQNIQSYLTHILNSPSQPYLPHAEWQQLQDLLRKHECNSVINCSTGALEKVQEQIRENIKEMEWSLHLTGDKLEKLRQDITLTVEALSQSALRWELQCHFWEKEGIIAMIRDLKSSYTMILLDSPGGEPVTEKEHYYKTLQGGSTWVPIIFQHTDMAMLGEGGQGQVYLGHRADTQEACIVKVIDSYHMLMGDIERELGLLHLLRQLVGYAKIDRWTDDGKEKPMMCLVSKLQEGQPLDKAARALCSLATKDGTTHSKIHRRILRALSNACVHLHSLHRRGIVHRDVKPSNIITNVKLPHAPTVMIDFGIAQITRTRDVEGRPSYHGWPDVGTPSFLAPEVQAKPKTTKKMEELERLADDTGLDAFTSTAPQDGLSEGSPHDFLTITYNTMTPPLFHFGDSSESSRTGTWSDLLPTQDLTIEDLEDSSQFRELQGGEPGSKVSGDTFTLSWEDEDDFDFDFDDEDEDDFNDEDEDQDEKGEVKAIEHEGNDLIKGQEEDRIEEETEARAKPVMYRRMLADFIAESKEELTLQKGEVVLVLSRDESGWWLGQSLQTGDTGWFPSTYTMEVAASDITDITSSSSTPYSRQSYESTTMKDKLKSSPKHQSGDVSDSLYCHYTPASDTYAMGVTMKRVYAIVNTCAPFTEVVGSQVRKLVAAMTHPSPASRPSLPHTIHILRELMKNM